MWRDYSSGLLKNNHTSVLSVRVSAFISALLLSLLCGLFYNMWKYEVERIEREEGGWHSRLIGEISDKDLEVIKNFGNVKDAVRNESEENSADLYFYDLRNVFSDTQRIVKLVGISPEKAVYNYPLLAMYLIHR